MDIEEQIANRIKEELSSSKKEQEEMPSFSFKVIDGSTSDLDLNTKSLSLVGTGESLLEKVTGRIEILNAKIKNNTEMQVDNAKIQGQIDTTDKNIEKVKNKTEKAAKEILEQTDKKIMIQDKTTENLTGDRKALLEMLNNKEAEYRQAQETAEKIRKLAA